MFMFLALFLFVTPAHAAATGGGFDPMSMMPLVLLAAIFYFFLIRPQQKKVATHKKMISDLQRGDRIVTNGGIVGQVFRVGTEETIAVEVAKGVRIQIMKGMVSQVLDKTFPLKLEELATTTTAPAKKAGPKKTPRGSIAKK